jgi:hypothetical protein
MGTSGVDLIRAVVFTSWCVGYIVINVLFPCIINVVRAVFMSVLIIWFKYSLVGRVAQSV